MRCSEVREMLPAYVRDGEQPLEVRRHISRCAECRAEMKRYESLLADLGSLAVASAEPPADLLPALVAIPSEADRLATVRAQIGGRAAAIREHVFRNKARYAGGVAVAIAGLAGAALVTKRRRLAPA